MLLSGGLLRRKNNPLLNHPLWLVVGSTSRSQSQAALHGDFVHADILDRGPNNSQTTGLRREDIDLIGPLAHITEQALNGIGGLNMSVHRGRKLVNEVGSQRVASAIDSEERFSKVVTL